MPPLHGRVPGFRVVPHVQAYQLPAPPDAAVQADARGGSGSSGSSRRHRRGSRKWLISGTNTNVYADACGGGRLGRCWHTDGGRPSRQAAALWGGPPPPPVPDEARADHSPDGVGGSHGGDDHVWRLGGAQLLLAVWSVDVIAAATAAAVGPAAAAASVSNGATGADGRGAPNVGEGVAPRHAPRVADARGRGVGWELAGVARVAAAAEVGIGADGARMMSSVFTR